MKIWLCIIIAFLVSLFPIGSDEVKVYASHDYEFELEAENLLDETNEECLISNEEICEGSIVSFDISPEGKFAIAYSNGCVNIYDDNFEFLLSLEPVFATNYVFWSGENLNLYCNKPDMCMQLNERYEVQGMYMVKSTTENYDLKYELYTKKQIDYAGATYRMDGLFLFPYTRFLKITDDNQTVLIDTTVKTVKPIIIKIVFISLAMLLIFVFALKRTIVLAKQTIKRKD